MVTGSRRLTGFQHTGHTRTASRVAMAQSAIKAILMLVLTALCIVGLASVALDALWLVAQTMRFLGPLVLEVSYWLMVPGLLYLLCYLPPILRITRRIESALS